MQTLDAKRPVLIVRAIRKLWRIATDGSYRHVLRLAARPPTSLYQPFNTTGLDRYPRIFKFVQSELGPERAVNILSFGCATGEEVFSLRGYFPQAAIKGIDINPGSIAVAGKRLRRIGDARLSFAVAAGTAAETTAFYDAIFCMAVLRHGALAAPGVSRCDHLIRFADFATMMEDFSRCLKPGGLLVIRHSNFRFRDTPASAAFDTILSIEPTAKTPLFGPDNGLRAGLVDPDTVFRKRPAATSS